MKLLIAWLWGMVPAPAKVWVLVGLSVAFFAIIGYAVWRIDHGGYNRCQSEHKEAQLQNEKNAREKIIKLEKERDILRAKIYKIQGPNDDVGPRTKFVIDRMRALHGSN